MSSNGFTNCLIFLLAQWDSAFINEAKLWARAAYTRYCDMTLGPRDVRQWCITRLTDLALSAASADAILD